MNTETRTKIAGIVCEPYKVKAFKNRLKNAGYEFTVDTLKYPPLHPLAGMKVIRVSFSDRGIPELTKICKISQIDAKLSN